MKNSRMKTLLIWGLLIGVFIVALNSGKNDERPVVVSFEVFGKSVDGQNVESYSFVPGGVRFWLRNDDAVYFAANDWADRIQTQEVMKKLQASGAEIIDHRQPSSRDGLQTLLIYLVLGLCFFVVLVIFLRKFGGGGTQNIFALRSSRARVAEESSKIRFDDIGGCLEAKQELSDLVSFLKSPQKWTDAGARLPRGVLLEGPPGCGKTLLARAVAGETDAKFYYTSASEFVEMFIGVGPARVRDMFETARKEAPAVLFIDEIDAIGRRRGSGVGFANEEREQTLNQILVCLDGFEPAESVVVIAATNRADILDKALVRAGRFDRRIEIELLGAAERENVLKIHTRDKSVSDEVSFAEVAALTEGFTGADLEALTNRAALLAVRRSGDSGERVRLCLADFQQALETRQAQERTFDALDAVLLEATTQIAEPVAPAFVRMTLMNDSVLEGEVQWIDPNFVKVRRTSDGSTCVVPKKQICQMESMAGTSDVSSDDLKFDKSPGDGPSFA
jgi:cell division protease FtsH